MSNTDPLPERPPMTNQELEQQMRYALEAALDPEPCRLDHHGLCQAHHLRRNAKGEPECEQMLIRAALSPVPASVSKSEQKRQAVGREVPAPDALTVHAPTTGRAYRVPLDANGNISQAALNAAACSAPDVRAKAVEAVVNAARHGACRHSADMNGDNCPLCIAIRALDSLAAEGEVQG